ncbi:MAG: hypothetical protein LBS53_07150, partial [Synergistaceae bacterium]|nr:hypothetical protein [Synergistaceae bacterium]
DEIITLKGGGLPGSVISGIFGAVLWVGILTVNISTVSELSGEMVMVVCGVGIAVNIVLTVRQLYGKRIVFDAGARVITIGRLFSGKTVIAFGRVARIAPITCKNLFFEYEAYCVVLAAAPISGVRIISPLFRPGRRGLIDFRDNILPKIEKILGLDRAGFKKSSGESRMPRRYEKVGTRYIKSFRRGLSTTAALCALFVFLPVAVPYFMKFDRVIMAVLISLMLPPAFVLAMILCFPVKSVSFDVRLRTLEITRGLLGWGGVKSYPFSSVKSLRVSCYTCKWENDGKKYLSVCVDGLKKPFMVIPHASKNREMESELEFLAGVLDLDPVYDTTYMQLRPNNSLLEVL